MATKIKTALRGPSPAGWRYESRLIRQCQVGDFVALFGGGRSKQIADDLNRRDVWENNWTWGIVNKNTLNSYADTDCVIRLEGPEFNEDGEICP